MPCGSSFNTEVSPPKLLGYSLKRRIRSLFLSGPRLPQDPPEQNAACVSLSLSTMSISSRSSSPPNLQTRGAETARTPLSGHPAAAPACRLFRHKSTPRRSTASLSDPAYMPPHTELSSRTREDFYDFSNALKPRGNSGNLATCRRQGAVVRLAAGPAFLSGRSNWLDTAFLLRRTSCHPAVMVNELETTRWDADTWPSLSSGTAPWRGGPASGGWRSLPPDWSRWLTNGAGEGIFRPHGDLPVPGARAERE
jgi:hypothetical protein